MELPRSYLSYSSISLWEKNKDGFRKRYYENVKDPETPEMAFGKKIAKLLEDNDPLMAKIPRYSSPEHKIEVIIGEVPLIGYVDSFEPGPNSILEYKTGRAKPDGKPRWDAVEVARTDQLPMYSLMVKEKYDTVDNRTRLVWLRTLTKQKSIEFDGHMLMGSGYDMELDPDHEPQAFERIVYEYERQFMKEKIIRVAREIEDDFKSYKRTNIGIL